MTSRFGNRATGVAAGTVIVLLVLLIVLLWTGVGQNGLPHRAGPGSSRPDAAANGSEARTAPASDDGNPDPKTSRERPSGDRRREYVRPMKISEASLTEQDLLYGSDRIQDGDLEPIQLRHHSGHFRHRTANIWDSHPIYEFTAFQRDFLLVLKHDTGFASPDLKVTHIWHNSSTRRLPNIKSNGCFYKGYVKGDPSSSVAVSLCHGMTGNIRTSTGNYFIEPFEVTSDHASAMEHVIYEMSKSGKDGHGHQHCGLDDESFKFQLRKASESTRTDSGFLFDYDTGDLHHHRKDYPDDHDSPARRSKRSTSEGYFVEMLVVADSSMAHYHGSNTENYILALMYIVSGIFKDASIGNPITIAVVKLEIHYELSFVKHRYPYHDGVSAAEMLREFCHDQALKNVNDEDSEYHHDTALLLTRENICRNASAQKCETLGLAELGTMCDKRSSCSLVQDNGLSAAFTIAHELGHVFNMPHDDAELKCRHHMSSDSVSHVMSTTLKEGTDPWSWSECSRHFITEFLESRHSSCLTDPPVRDRIRAPPDVFPGETIVGNKQCELLYGEGSRICAFMPVCSALWCNKLDSDGCQTLHMPWGDGTPCREGEWCQKGHCVEKNRSALKKIDGGWGEWEPYGKCSRTCGGGVRRSYRHCDNPRPQNGGSYCTGKRVQYKSCATKECPEGSMGFREKQCSAFNRNNHGIHGIPTNVTWVPKYGLLDDDRCVLYCRQYKGTFYYPLREKVADGTPCDPDTFDICVNGQCMPAGCDHVLHSKAKLDLCGVCNGSNDTCRMETGAFNESATVEGYRPVVVIPAGSSNLDIRQFGVNGVRDCNYLVLKDGLTKYGLLNNDNILTTFRKTIQYGDMKLDYSGCLTPVERINATRPLPKDLIVEILSVGNLTPPSISYQYTVPLAPVSNGYMWRYLNDEWESCDQVCNGQRKQKMVCVTTHNNQIVHDGYCRHRRRLAPIYQKCNTQCTLRWRITSRSECSSPCGPGVRTVTKQCIQEIEGKPEPYTVHNSSCAHLPNPPPDEEECEGLCSSVDWEYSPWSECSKTCGSGIRVRDAYCLDKINKYVVEEERCDPLTKLVEEMCRTERCPTWSTGKWSECSVSCGVGTRTRGYWCQHNNQVIDMRHCDARAMPKHTENCTRRCTFWSSTDWGECDVPCGVGKRRRSTVCKNYENQIVENSQCRKQERPTETERCEMPPCPRPVHNIEDNNIPHHYRPGGGYGKKKMTMGARWVKFDRKDSCSVTCGTGFRTLHVKCMTPNGEVSDACHPSSKPNTTVPCHMGPCPPEWITGQWSPCTTTCGKGTQQRQVLCSDITANQFVKDEECSRISPKPEVEKGCWTPCPHKRRYKWIYDSWSPCSQSCGYGEKFRKVRCMNITNESNEVDRTVTARTIVDDRFCRIKNRRSEKKKCLRKLCPFTWLEGRWSLCSEKCGKGTQNRTVTCHQVNEYQWLDPIPLKNETMCNSASRPFSHRNCTVDCSPDLGYHWSPEDWQECTHACGRKGTQRRTYKCRDSDGREVDKMKCNDLNKPLPRSQPCNRRPCGFHSCKDIQVETNARSDGQYTMVVGGRNMSIYCKRMNSVLPEEYLTLNQIDENYSEYQTKRLNHSACKADIERMDNCTCGAGVTHFHRVRLIVDTLQIQADDFTFSKTQGRPIPYGLAGYCCCRRPCTHSRFRINLSGTDFQISHTDRRLHRSNGEQGLQLDGEGRRLFGHCPSSPESWPCSTCGPSAQPRIKLHVVPP